MRGRPAGVTGRPFEQEGRLTTQPGADHDSFADVASRLGLRRFLASDPGTLYFDPADVGVNRLLYRAFETQPPGFAATYAEVVGAVVDWVATRPRLAELIEIIPTVQVGLDYIARPHRTYYVSTDTYAHPEDGVQAPPELAAMRDRLATDLIEMTPGIQGQVLAHVLRRTLLEPSGRVYFDDNRRLFVVVEPKVTSGDVADWQATG